VNEKKFFERIRSREKCLLHHRYSAGFEKSFACSFSTLFGELEESFYGLLAVFDVFWLVGGKLFLG
jgi:hypothetical protein